VTPPPDQVFVFLGPTLPITEARQFLEATYLPPVSMGDVFGLVDRQPAAIAIIDGLFEQTPAVWHKEILFALSQGIRVFGASSMGALRAAELHAFGMEGVGEIFESFRDEILEDDDEVAVVHGAEAEGYRCLSDAMVNIRHGLTQATAAGVISEATSSRLIAEAKSRYYPERSWHGLLRAAGNLGVSAAERTRLQRWLAQNKPDLKRADAIALLSHLAQQLAVGLAPHQPTFAFEPTYFWNEMTEIEATRLRDVVTPSRSRE
jgi:hypothetical protein